MTPCYNPHSQISNSQVILVGWPSGLMHDVFMITSYRKQMKETKIQTPLKLNWAKSYFVQLHKIQEPSGVSGLGDVKHMDTCVVYSFSIIKKIAGI